jgi:hypothetical protein
MSHWIKAFSDIWPQLMRMSSTGAVPMLNNRLTITKCIHNGEANVWPGADRVTRPRRIRRLGRCLMSSTTPMTTPMRSVRGLFIHSARPRPSSSYICLSILSSVWPHIQFPSVRMLDSGNRKKGQPPLLSQLWRRRVEKEEGGPRATELAFQSSMARGVCNK